MFLHFITECYLIAVICTLFYILFYSYLLLPYAHNLASHSVTFHYLVLYCIFVFDYIDVFYSMMLYVKPYDFLVFYFQSILFSNIFF